MELLLDSDIRWWVVLPIFAITFLFGILRHYASLLLKSNKKLDKVQLMESHALMRSRLLRTNGNYISKQGFFARKTFFADTNGLFVTKRRDVPPPNPMTDPSMMQDMMKGQMVNMVPMMVMGGVISWFFSGFVTLKVPFPLTTQFKQMLQRGVELTTLGSSWVSSMSFYFICLFGMRSLFSLVLGENNSSGQQMNNMGMGEAGPMPEPGKIFDAEREALQVTGHTWALDGVEQRYINRIN
eukprot:m.15897 g.15897  ORF g.15897 m.15897 type:complete len:240 (-) comp6785_c0_seq1:161-880(-)